LGLTIYNHPYYGDGVSDVAGLKKKKTIKKSGSTSSKANKGYTAKDIIKVIPGTHGNLHTIAKKLKLDFATAWSWCNENPEVQPVFLREKKIGDDLNKIDETAIVSLARGVFRKGFEVVGGYLSSKVIEPKLKIKIFDSLLRSPVSSLIFGQSEKYNNFQSVFAPTKVVINTSEKNMDIAEKKLKMLEEKVKKQESE